MTERQINGGMVLLARKRRRLTQAELSELSGVAQAAISRLENGTRDMLSDDELEKLSLALNFPTGFFFEHEALYRRPLSAHSAAFRKKASSGVKDQDGVVALANHYILQLRRMLEAVDVEPEFPLLQFEIVKNKDGASDHARAVSSASEAAQKIRASWQLGDGPLLGLMRYIEATGVIVVIADFDEADIDGLTLRPAGMKPVIFLNKNRPSDRIRFSLAHEYGHVILHSFPDEDMEREANEFAAELLMPRKGISNDLKKTLTLRYLGSLKLKWNVAMSALIFRAKNLQVADENAVINLYKQMSRYGYRIKEPVEFDIPLEQASLIKNLIDLHVGELGYSVEELSRGVNTFPGEFAEMYSLEGVETRLSGRPKLRLVASNE